MTRILAIITTTCLTLAACGGSADGGDTTPSTTAPKATSDRSTTTASGSSDEPAALGASPARCASPQGYSISYPSEWWANDGSVVDACELFAPEPIDLEPATDVTAPIYAFVDPVSFDVAAAPTESGEEVGRAVTLVDGTRAVRLVSSTGDGLFPEGTEVTSYIIDASATDDDRTLIAATAHLSAYDYDRNVRVLDAMAQTLDLDIDTPRDLVARYEGGGAPFDVTAVAAADAVCLSVSPPDEAACMSPPTEGAGIVADTVGDVAIGLAAPSVFEVGAVDAISFLPTPIAGTDARGWAIPIDGETRIVAVDRSGELLASAVVGG